MSIQELLERRSARRLLLQRLELLRLHDVDRVLNQGCGRRQCFRRESGQYAYLRGDCHVEVPHDPEDHYLVGA